MWTSYPTVKQELISMPIRAQEENGALTAYLSGEIDHASARSLMLALDREVVQRAPRTLRVDMSAVTFMDSSGIAVLLRTWRRTQEAQTAMEVVAVPRQPWKVFSAAGLPKIIPMEAL